MATQASVATVGETLRTQYTENNLRLYPIHSIMDQLFPKKNVAEGKEIKQDLHHAAGGGTGSGKRTPPASVYKVKQDVHNLKRVSAAINIDDELIAVSASSEASGIPDPLEELNRNMMDVYRDNCDIMQVYGDGSGKIAQFGASPAATATTFTLPYDARLNLRQFGRYSLLLNAPTYVAAEVEKGLGNTGASGLQRFDLTFALPTTPGGAITCTIDDGQTLPDGGTDLNANPANYGLYLADSFMNVPFGLGAIMSVSNPGTNGYGRDFYGGIDRSLAANDFYKPLRTHNSGTGRPLTYLLFQEVRDELELMSGWKGMRMYCFTPHKFWNQLIEHETFKQRWTGPMKRIRGWASSIELENITFVKVKHMPQDRVWLIDPETIEKLQNDDGGWADRDGSILKMSEGEFTWQAFWHQRFTWRCKAPNHNAIIEDLVAYS